MGDAAFEALEVMPKANVSDPVTVPGTRLRANVPATRETSAANVPDNTNVPVTRLRVNVPVARETSTTNEPASASSRRNRRRKLRKQASNDHEFISNSLSDQATNLSEHVQPLKKQKLLTHDECPQDADPVLEPSLEDEMDLDEEVNEPRAPSLDVPANVPTLQQTPDEPKRMSLTLVENIMNSSPIDISPSDPQPTPAQSRINLELLSRASRVSHDVGEQVKVRLTALLGKDVYDQFILDTQKDTGIIPNPAPVAPTTVIQPSPTGHVHGIYVPRKTPAEGGPPLSAVILGSHPCQPLSTDPGPSMSMRAVEQLQPVGWPAEDDLYNMTADALCIYWIKANESSFLAMTHEIQVTAMPTRHKIPKPLSKKWTELYVAYVKAQRLGRSMPFEGVRTVQDFDVFWKQRMRPPGVLEALMSYNPGPDMSLPQWPRLTAQNLLDVFPQFGNTENPIVQQHVRDYLQGEPDYPVLLVEAWEMFDTLRVIAEQPPVAMEDFKELRLEHEVWLPGAEPFRFPKGAHQPANRNTTDPLIPVQRGTTMHPPNPVYREALQRPVPLPPVHTRVTPPTLPVSHDLSGREQQRQRTEEYASETPRGMTNMEHAWANAQTAGVLPSAELMEWARNADLADRNANLNKGTTPHVPSTSHAPNFIPVPVSVPVPEFEHESDLTERSLDPHYDSQYDSGPSVVCVPNNPPVPTNPAANANLTGAAPWNPMNGIKRQTRPDTIDPECPLPIISGDREAASDYLGWNVPMVCGFAYKAFTRDHNEYVPEGKVSWEDWTFAIRDTCRNLGLDHDQTWRLGNRLLPIDLKGRVEDVVTAYGFKGLCYNTWKMLISTNTELMNPITAAKDEMSSLTFKTNELIPQFLQRFNRIVQKGTAQAEGIEEPMTPYYVLTNLNRIFQNPGANGPKWLIGAWKDQYSLVHTALKFKNTMGMSEQGCKYTTIECAAHIKQATVALIDFVRGRHETRQTTTNDIKVLHTSNVPSNTDHTDDNSQRRSDRNNSNRGPNRHAPGSNALVTVPNTRRGSNPSGVACRGGRKRQASTPQEMDGPPLTDTVNVAGAAQGHVRGQPVTVPEPRANWTELARKPPGMNLSSQAQAAAEFGIVTFDLARERYRQSRCAACNEPHSRCRGIKDCTHIPANLKAEVAYRSGYLWALSQNRGPPPERK